MTLIAMALSEKPPIMTADILITSDKGEPNVKLPNRPVPLSDDEIMHLDSKPDSFLQKLYVIQPNICMCVAGGVYEIKLILEDFRNFCKWKTNSGKQLLKLEEVRDWFSTYDQDTLKEVVLGIAVAADKKSGYIFTPDIHKEVWESTVANDFGAIFAAGSGATQYLKHIAWHNQFDSSHEPGDLMYTKQVNFAFITKLLCKENKTLKSLDDYWGGFLEVCYFNGDNFEKIGDVVFVICDAASDDQGNMGLPMPRLFIYSQYVSNVLYLTSVEATDFILSQSGESIEYVSTNFTKTLFSVEEIDGRSTATTLREEDDLSFVSTQIALGINLMISPRTHLPISAYSEGGGFYAEFVDGNYLKLVWPVLIQEKHAAMVKKYYPQIKDAVDGRNPSDRLSS